MAQPEPRNQHAELQLTFLLGFLVSSVNGELSVIPCQSLLQSWLSHPGCNKVLQKHATAGIGSSFVVVDACLLSQQQQLTVQAPLPVLCAEDHEDMDLPKVNEELRNFFLPRKQVQPEPEPAVEVGHVAGSEQFAVGMHRC